MQPLPQRSDRAALAALRLAEINFVPARKRRTTALWLCLLLGWAGVHRFYVGKRGSGRLYLWTGGLLFVGVIYDCVCILTGSFTDRTGRPLV
jgi:hypothetical protein